MNQINSLISNSVDFEKLMTTPVVFLTGSSRSGTTLLSNILHTHSQIISCPENGFISTHFNKFKNRKNFSEDDVKSFIKHLWIRKRLMQQAWSIDLNSLTSHLSKESQRLNFANASKLVYQHYAPEKEAKVYIDKNPGHINNLNRLNTVFEKPKFIVIVRDYRDRYASLVKLKKKSKLRLLRHRGFSWNRHQKKAIRFRDEHPEQTLIIRYEDLIQEPSAQLQIICEFLSLNMENTLLRHEKHLTVNFSAGQTSYGAHFNESHKKSNEAVDASNIGKYQHEVAPSRINELEYMCGAIGKSFGYERSKEYKSPNPFKAGFLLCSGIFGLIGHQLQSVFFKIPLSWQAGIINFLHKRLYS